MLVDVLNFIFIMKPKGATHTHFAWQLVPRTIVCGRRNVGKPHIIVVMVWNYIDDLYVHID